MMAGGRARAVLAPRQRHFDAPCIVRNDEGGQIPLASRQLVSQSLHTYDPRIASNADQSRTFVIRDPLLSKLLSGE
jgi:hypothetical protein